jgi:N utilization substance protein B
MYEVSKSTVENIIEFEWLDGEIAEDEKTFAVQLIQGVIKEIERIDAIITDYSKNWKFERIAITDKSILRLAIYEMLFIKDIPAIVTINECIDLGKTFGGENSGQFINGILDAVKKHELREG